jgi:hypothetical protein
MVNKFMVEAHESGLVITPLGLGCSEAKVFEKQNIESALTEMYRLCYYWRIGDRVKIVKKEDATASS